MVSAWYVDSMYFNNGTSTDQYTWSDEGGWAPFALYGDDTPSPVNPFNFSLSSMTGTGQITANCTWAI
jgi:hypothetical protein